MPNAGKAWGPMCREIGWPHTPFLDQDDPERYGVKGRTESATRVVWAHQLSRKTGTGGEAFSFQDLTLQTILIGISSKETP